MKKRTTLSRFFSPIRDTAAVPPSLENKIKRYYDEKFAFLAPPLDKYIISSYGSCISLKRKEPHFLRPGLNISGYLYYHLSTDGLSFLRQAHRLVALHFVYNDNPVIKDEVNHLTGDKFWIHTDLLEWTSKAGNTEHAKANHLFVQTGFNQYKRKFTDEQVRNIKTSPLSQRQLARDFNACCCTISRIRKNKRYQHVKV